jgi:hypothetical protein
MAYLPFSEIVQEKLPLSITVIVTLLLNICNSKLILADLDIRNGATSWYPFKA